MAALDVEVFECISMLAKGLGEQLGNMLDEIVEPMFCAGLSQPLADAVSDVCSAMPRAYLQKCQRLMFELLAIILHKKPCALCSYGPI
jgi:FKBP12-rapamycin complex-associated protein